MSKKIEGARYKGDALRQLIFRHANLPDGFVRNLAEASATNAVRVCDKLVEEGVLIAIQMMGSKHHYFQCKELADKFAATHSVQRSLRALREIALRLAATEQGYSPSRDSVGMGNSFLVCQKFCEEGILFKYKLARNCPSYYFTTQEAADKFKILDTTTRLNGGKARDARKYVKRKVILARKLKKVAVVKQTAPKGKDWSFSKKNIPINWPSDVKVQLIDSKLKQTFLQDYEVMSGEVGVMK